MLVVDDLHWADQGTVDLLRFLLRRVGSTRTLLVGTVRDDELDVGHPMRALLGDVARSPHATTLRLRPLSVAAIATMIDDRPIDPHRIEQLTGGNPFFVGEMLAHAGDDLPTSVRDAILSRTTELDADAWDLLHLLACAPEAIPDHLLAKSRHRPPTAAGPGPSGTHPARDAAASRSVTTCAAWRSPPPCRRAPTPPSTSG